jgi:hypothetical protein
VCLDRGREASGSTERNSGVAFSVFTGASSSNADRLLQRRIHGEKGVSDDDRADQETEADEPFLGHDSHRSRAGCGWLHARRQIVKAAYLSAVETDENVVLSLVPRPETTEMIASAIPAAIKPYSIAVAAFSSFQNLMIRRIGNIPSRSGQHWPSKSLEADKLWLVSNLNQELDRLSNQG